MGHTAEAVARYQAALQLTPQRADDRQAVAEHVRFFREAMGG